MSTIQIFRDAPIIASKVRPRGSMPNRSEANPDGRNIAITTYLSGSLSEDPNPQQQQLTQQSRRGDRHYRNNWVRTEWQSLNRFF